MTKRHYPDDGGLKEPVREFGEGFSAFAMIRDHFRLPERTDRREDFDRFAIPCLFLSVKRKDGTGGHMRLFSSRAGHGWVFYSYHNQAGSAPGWAMHRIWNFGLFAIHHIGPGKATDPQGWHATFAGLKFERSYRGFTIRWELADKYRTGKRV